MFCHVCIVLREVCVSAWTRSWAYARALAKDREKDGERAKERDSADIWVHLTERTALQAGPSPFSTKNDTWLLWLLSSPCLHTPPNQSLQQTLRQAHIPTHTCTLKDTQLHTVYCLDYIIPFPRTRALLVGWHLGLCSSKVTFLCPWVKEACLPHAFKMKDGGKKKKKIRWERFPKALWSEASTVTHKLVKQYVNLGWYWIKLPEWHESIVLRWSK